MWDHGGDSWRITLDQLSLVLFLRCETNLQILSEQREESENNLLTVPTAPTVATRRETRFWLEGDFKYKSSGRFEQVQPKRDFWLLGLFVLKDF